MFSCWLVAKVLVDMDELMSLYGHSVSLSSAASQHRRDTADTCCFSSVQVHNPSSADTHPVDSWCFSYSSLRFGDLYIGRFVILLVPRVESQYCKSCWKRPCSFATRILSTRRHFPSLVASTENQRIDVNNALLREFTSFPCLYPTIMIAVSYDYPYGLYGALRELKKKKRFAGNKCRVEFGCIFQRQIDSRDRTIRRY